MPAKTERRHQQGEESRQAILEATLEIAAERGYDGTTVALVTERTGLPASSIYWHFGSKDALLAATLEHSYREWRKTAPTWSTTTDRADPSDQIAARFQRAAQALTASPEFWSLGLLLTLQQRVKEPAARRLYARVRAETEGDMVTWWESILSGAATTADPGLPQRLARMHMMLMDGLLIRSRSLGSATDSRRAVQVFATALATHLTAVGAL